MTTILSTIVPAGISPAWIANLLERAETIHGHRATAFVRVEDPATFFGSVLAAGFGYARWPSYDHEAAPLVRAAEVALCEHLGVRDGVALHAWALAHTHDEQRAALADTAATLRTEAGR